MIKLITGLLTVLINSICFRIRGGLDIPCTDKNFPFHKWWFAFSMSSCASYLKSITEGWNWNFFLVTLIASRFSTQSHGWGEYKGCALGVAKPDPERHDMFEVDEFLDNFEFRGWKLIDHPILYGIAGLTCRGFFLTFIIGLALNSIPFMACGAAWGIICYLCGLFSRKVKTLEKGGWNLDEYIFGGYIGLCLYLCLCPY